MEVEQIATRLNDSIESVIGRPTAETWNVRRAAYRLLAQGEPVTLAQIADAAGTDVAQVERCLQGSSDIADDGRIRGAMGLSLRPTQHHMRIGGTQLYTWCALDLLFIPRALEATAEIESKSPASGEVIRAVVTPHGIHSLDPQEAVVSVIQMRSGHDEVRSAFCNHVHFFSSEIDAASWQNDHPEGWVLAASSAFDLAARFIDHLAGDCCG